MEGGERGNERIHTHNRERERKREEETVSNLEFIYVKTTTLVSTGN